MHTKSLDKLCGPRSDWVFRSSLIRVFPVCYSEKHLVNSCLYNRHSNAFAFLTLKFEAKLQNPFRIGSTIFNFFLFGEVYRWIHGQKSCFTAPLVWLCKTKFRPCFLMIYLPRTRPCSAFGNVSGNRCESDCRSRGREFDPGPVPYFRGDWSWNNFYRHSPPFL